MEAGAPSMWWRPEKFYSRRAVAQACMAAWFCMALQRWIKALAGERAEGLQLGRFSAIRSPKTTRRYVRSLFLLPSFGGVPLYCPPRIRG